MNKNTLLCLSDICDNVSIDMYELYNELIDKMALSDSERQRIEDAILVTMHKIDQIKASKISELSNHVDMEQLEVLSGEFNITRLRGGN